MWDIATFRIDAEYRQLLYAGGQNAEFLVKQLAPVSYIDGLRIVAAGRSPVGVTNAVDGSGIM
jgi:hypothetical protein